MTLPFNQQPEKGARKWQCFVCGLIHGSYEESAKHILEKHEEGRDFVRCPLPRCGAPVRDIRLHMRAKHPTEKLESPKGPLKAMVWRDQRQGGVGKKSRGKTRKFREGTFVSTKMHGREFYYRSGWECEVYECLEELNEVLGYEAEPFKEGIPYLFNGSMHRYHPDLAIKFDDGHVEVWEIKPADQTDLPVNKAKWEAAEKYCLARGWEFVPVTEVGIRKLKAKVRQRKAWGGGDEEEVVSD